MNQDPITRLLLVAIFVALLVLIAQGARDGSSELPRGRYHVTGMRAGAPVLIRTDTVTGQVWKLELRGGGNRWRPFIEPDAEERGKAREPGETRGTSAEQDVVEPPGGLEAARAELEAARPTLEELGLRETQEPVTPEEVAMLLEAVGETELPAEVRAWSLEQLATVEGPEAVRALIDALDDRDATVAVAAVRVLARRPEPEARRALERARDHRDPSVRDAASTALAGSDG